MRWMMIAAVLFTAVSAEAKRVQTGLASFYGAEFAGRKTASGKIFRPNKLTMAHRYAALGSWARVTNLRNHRSVVVRIIDRGPYHGRRVADLSRGAAAKLHMLRQGVAPVKITFYPHRRRG